MKVVGSPSGAGEARAEAALGHWSAIVGAAPRYAPLLPSVMMPMHVAGDAVPYAVAPTGSEAPTLFLKAYEPDMPEGIDLAATAAASRQAAALGLAPDLVAEDVAQGALLYRLLPASQWRLGLRADLDRPAVKAAALAAKRGWHRSTPLQRSRSPFTLVRTYVETIGALAGPPAGLRRPEGFHTLLAWVDRIEQGLAAAGCDSGPTHGENTISNVMIGDGDAVRLVDFDRAWNADPHHDLGAFCSEMCSFDDEVAETVELYLGSPDARVTARAQLYMVVDDVLWGCWGLIAHHTSARSTSVEYYKYARNRFLRARYWLARWDMDALLRRI